MIYKSLSLNTFAIIFDYSQNLSTVNLNLGPSKTVFSCIKIDTFQELHENLSAQRKN